MANQKHRPSAEELAAATSSFSDAEVQPGLSERDSFRITCLRNVHYHEDRERFFYTIHRLAMFIVVAGGTAFFASIKANSSMFVGIVTLAGLLDLVFDLSGKARLHATLRTRFYALLAQNAAGVTPVDQLVEQSIRIYADEPPCMYAANALAYNNAMLSLDRPHKYLFKIDFRHKWFRHFWAFASADFKTFEELSFEELSRPNDIARPAA